MGSPSPLLLQHGVKCPSIPPASDSAAAVESTAEPDVCVAASPPPRALMPELCALMPIADEGASSRMAHESQALSIRAASSAEPDRDPGICSHDDAETWRGWARALSWLLRRVLVGGTGRNRLGCEARKSGPAQSMGCGHARKGQRASSHDWQIGER
jgi:hypothetical protein